MSAAARLAPALVAALTACGGAPSAPPNPVAPAAPVAAEPQPDGPLVVAAVPGLHFLETFSGASAELELSAAACEVERTWIEQPTTDVGYDPLSDQLDVHAAVLGTGHLVLDLVARGPWCCLTTLRIVCGDDGGRWTPLAVELGEQTDVGAMLIWMSRVTGRVSIDGGVAQPKVSGCFELEGDGYYSVRGAFTHEIAPGDVLLYDTIALDR